MTPVVCSIGITDPWNAAGLGLDVAAIADCGARAVSVVVGVSAQDRHGIAVVHAVPPAIVAAQFAALREARVVAYRIGALCDAAAVAVIANEVARSGVPVVYDPVFAASAGGTFADAATRTAAVAALLPHVTLLTPNLAEAAELTASDVRDPREMTLAAETLRARGASSVLVKGGHLEGAVVDVLVDAEGTVAYEAPRLAGTLRGTGCLVACAAAVALGRGESLRDAVTFARAFVRSKFETRRAAGGMSLAY